MTWTCIVTSSDRVEAGIHGEEPAKAPQQQPRADQQHQRERHLGNDQRAPRPPLPAGRPARAVLQRLVRVRLAPCSAGASPKARPMSVVRTNPNANTEASTPIASTRGSPGGASATSARTPTTATTIPSTPPRMASSRLSVSTWRTRRPRPAPSAARSASSPRRSDAAREQQVGDVDARRWRAGALPRRARSPARASRPGSRRP